MTKMFYFKPHAVLFVSAGVLAFICRCARTNKRGGRRGAGGRKTKLHLHRQSKLHWLSCVSYNVVITSIRTPPHPAVKMNHSSGNASLRPPRHLFPTATERTTLSQCDVRRKYCLCSGVMMLRHNHMNKAMKRKLLF